MASSKQAPHLTRRPRASQAGFTLVEIMVGLAIGMLATLVIMQVFSVFESQKRVTTGTADAQTNGSIALYNIGRELQLAGYPLMPAPTTAKDSPLECTTLTIDAGTGIGGIFPVSITNGVSDSITLRYGDSLKGGISTPIGPVAAPNITVDTNFGCQDDDTALIINGASCNVTSVVTAASATPTTITLQDAAGAVAGAYIACLGNWDEITYAVNNSNLERSGVAGVAGIVNLQAQYGVSAAANSNEVTAWVNANSSNGDGIDWAAPTVAERNRIKAVRIAVVARNAKKELANVTSACSSTTADSPTGLCAWVGSASSPAPAVTLSADPDWEKYRYRVFETVIPLRNIIWSKDSL